MEHKILLVIHVLSAMIWTGGLLILSIGVLPGALRHQDQNRVSTFMKSFERIGHSVLFLQILTGIRLASLYLPMGKWFSGETTSGRLIVLKLILLGFTVVLIFIEKLLIKRTTEERRLGLYAMIYLAMTLIAILLVLAGLSFRFGILM